MTTNELHDRSASDYGSPLFAALRLASGPAWQRYVRHPFVEELGSGRLAGPAFIGYLVQDYLFLRHFVRAWALVIVKADTIEEMRTAAAMVDALVNHEMQLHVATCARHGISACYLEAATEKTANIAYTRYVLDAGFSGDLAELLAALVPCVFGYGEIGLRLARQPVPDNPYAEWVATYAGDEYQQVCRDVGALLEASLHRRLGAQPMTSVRWRSLVARFTRASELEAGFWQMAHDADSY